MGISNIFARVFVISAPMIAEVSYPTPVIIFTSLNVFAVASSLFLIDPEGDNNDSKDAVALENKK